MLNSVLRRKVRRLFKNSSVFVLIAVGIFYVATVNAIYYETPITEAAPIVAEEYYWGKYADGNCQRSEDVILYGAKAPEKICVWGTNEDGSCEEVDPCVYSDVVCSPETRAEQRRYDIQEMIKEAARKYGVDEELALRVADCESGFDEFASNDHSTAKGLYQFLDSTWADIKAQGHQYDAEENIKNFMIWYQVHPEWWECK